MSTIKQLRTKIDKIDANIIKKLSERQKASVQIGQLKAKQGKTVLNKQREKELLLYHKKLCIQHHVQPELVRKLFKIIMANSRKLQK